mgnify:CR=1 FL=1
MWWTGAVATTRVAPRPARASHAPCAATFRWGGHPLDDAIRHNHKECVAVIEQHGGVRGPGVTRSKSRELTSSPPADQLMVSAVGLSHWHIHQHQPDNRVQTSRARCRRPARLLCAGMGTETRRGCALVPYVPPTCCGHASAELFPAIALHTPAQSLIVDWREVNLLEKIGSGGFGDIFRATWRGTTGACKMIRSDMIEKEKEAAIADFRCIRGAAPRPSAGHEHNLSRRAHTALTSLVPARCVSIEVRLLQQLRHPNVCMLLGYSTTKDHEVCGKHTPGAAERGARRLHRLATVYRG